MSPGHKGTRDMRQHPHVNQQTSCFAPRNQAMMCDVPNLEREYADEQQVRGNERTSVWADITRAPSAIVVLTTFSLSPLSLGERISETESLVHSKRPRTGTRVSGIRCATCVRRSHRLCRLAPRSAHLERAPSSCCGQRW